MEAGEKEVENKDASDVVATTEETPATKATVKKAPAKKPAAKK